MLKSTLVSVEIELPREANDTYLGPLAYDESLDEE
jgi:hypothetical protein